ncbi:MAG: hypothetical protein U0229_04375 [Anaeromyxobacter sp.]
MRPAPLAVLAATLLLAAPARADFSKAKQGDKPKDCPKGSFLDLRLDDLSAGSECWKCPDGFARTAYGVTEDDACSKAGGETFKEADYKHSWGCDEDEGEFFDPRKGGECWSCPKSKPRRTAYKVTSDKACATKELIGEKLGPAKFEHKFKGCGGRSFYDPRKGGQCWSCPKGFTRTAYAVTDDKACAKPAAESLKPATRVSKYGCEAGEFWDPRNGGECWSCPKGNFRTVNPVDGPRACTDRLLDIFAADTKVFCRQLVGALAKGDKGYDDLQKLVTPYVDAVKKPVEQKLDDLSDLVTDLDEVQKLLDQTVGRLDGKVMDDAKTFAGRVGAAQGKLKAMLLDEKLMCDSGPKEVEARIRELNLTDAIAQNFIAIGVSSTFIHPTYHTAMDVGLTWVTNLNGEGGLYASVGLGATSSTELASAGVGAMFYPKTKLSDFATSPAPGLTVSLGKGPGFDKAAEKIPGLAQATALVDSIEVGWNWDPKTLPTLGFSKGLVATPAKGKALLAASASGGWDFPILTYANWKAR